LIASAGARPAEVEVGGLTLTRSSRCCGGSSHAEVDAGSAALIVRGSSTAGAFRISAARRARDAERGRDRCEDDSCSNAPFNFLVLLHVTTTNKFLSPRNRSF
jgi:hypothetical protein